MSESDKPKLPSVPALPWKGTGLTLPWAKSTWLSLPTVWWVPTGVGSSRALGSAVGSTNVAKSVLASSQRTSARVNIIIDKTASTWGEVIGRLFAWAEGIVKWVQDEVDLTIVPAAFTWARTTDNVWYAKVGKVWDLSSLKEIPHFAGSTHMSAWINAALWASMELLKDSWVTVVFTDGPFTDDADAKSALHGMNIEELKARGELVVFVIDSQVYWHDFETLDASFRTAFSAIADTPDTRDNVLVINWVSNPADLVWKLIKAKAKAKKWGKVNIAGMLPSIAAANPHIRIGTGSSGVLKITDGTK